MHTDTPTSLSAVPKSLSDAKTLLVPPPPKPRQKAFEYQESEVERDLSDHVERSLAEEAGDYPTAHETQLEGQDLTLRLRRIYLKIFGKGGMIL